MTSTSYLKLVYINRIMSKNSAKDSEQPIDNSHQLEKTRKIIDDIEIFNRELNEYDIPSKGYRSISETDDRRRDDFNRDIEYVSLLLDRIKEFARTAEQVLLDIYGENSGKSFEGRELYRLVKTANYRHLAMTVIYAKKWPVTAEDI